jgi:hypothetical protein
MNQGYPSSPYVLRPFTDPETNDQPRREQTRRRAFNRRISSIRVYVEHAFGMLKGRFPALKEFPAMDDMLDVYRTVEALMVIHNLCIDWGDHPEAICDYDPQNSHEDEEDEELNLEMGIYSSVELEGEGDVPAYETDPWLKREGDRKRMNIVNDMFPM